MTSPSSDTERLPWYRGVTFSQWLVLILASAGWLFDVYEGQIYNITRDHLLADLNAGSDAHFYGEFFLAVFLAGGALGGISFGVLADRWGRRPVLVLTILTYSLFSGLTFFAEKLWQVGVLRFLVAFGVGGEWSVASAMVAEAFRVRGRAQAGSIFHATSILGTWLAALAGWLVGEQWRYAYLLGVLPALLVVGLRAGIALPESKGKVESEGGSIRELLADPRWRRHAILGLFLAAVGLGTFWGITVEGQALAKHRLMQDVERQPPAERRQEPEEFKKAADAKAKLAYGWIETTGGGLGLLAFGPLAARWGRRRTFIVFHLAAIAIVPLTCYAPQSYGQLLALLPVYGFFTLGIHAGYAVYFPELFPTRLRATGAGFCFNGGRVAAASVLVFSGWLKNLPGMEIHLAVTLLSGLFLLGVVIVLFLPETKDQPLLE
jgi:MFS family permease